MEINIFNKQFITASKRMEYLSINWIKAVQDLYTVKKFLNKWISCNPN